MASEQRNLNFLAGPILILSVLSILACLDRKMFGVSERSICGRFSALTRAKSGERIKFEALLNKLTHQNLPRCGCIDSLGVRAVRVYDPEFALSRFLLQERQGNLPLF